jgi:hypothetical protein
MADSELVSNEGKLFLGCCCCVFVDVVDACLAAMRVCVRAC